MPAKIIHEQRTKNEKANFLRVLPKFANISPDFGPNLPEICPNSYIGKMPPPPFPSPTPRKVSNLSRILVFPPNVGSMDY